MKTTITLTVIGLLLFIFSMGSSITYSCFHCGPSLSHSLASNITALFSMFILSLVFVRLFKSLGLIQLNSYNAESLVPNDPWDYYVVPQHKPIHIFPTMDLPL